MSTRAVGVFVVGAMTIAVAAYGAYRLGMSRGMAQPAAQPAVTAGSPGQVGERRILYWHDPMVPGHRFDKPGKSPFMDMQLVPVYAESDAAPGVNVSAG